MRTLSHAVTLTAMTILFACQNINPGGWSNSAALRSDDIDVVFDDDGRPAIVEYHIAPEVLPPAVRRSAERLLNASTVDRAAFRYHYRDVLYLARVRRGETWRTGIYHRDGTLVETVEPIDDGDLPPAMRTRTSSSWAAIHRDDGSLVRYETPKPDVIDDIDRRHVFPDGTTRTYTAVAVELEVPTRRRP